MKTVQHRFVELIPEDLEEEIVYISIQHCTAIHKCVCGCGNEVVTPLSPTDWKLIFNGETISLRPSIGNWNFECQSHYWVVENKIEHSNKWDKEKIQSNQEDDLIQKKKFFAKRKKKKKNK